MDLPGLELKADPEELEILRKISSNLVTIFSAIKTDEPANIVKLPPVRVENLKDLKPYFEMVEKTTKHLAVAITLVSSKMERDTETPRLLQEIKELLQKIYSDRRTS